MKWMGLNEIREKYLAFFEGKSHLRMASASLVPRNDKSLLLINSGMAPLKPYFTGYETPPNRRVTTCQKCIRTGDIENVGVTARHGTFFEMLGNFSFGDYFKEETIRWAWEFVTEVMEIPADRLYVSIYQDDDEAFDIWNKKIGIAPERIFRMGKDDNFWEVGLGPCGPCSEIYYDKGERFGCGKPGCTVGCDCDRYVEFWNLVFTQFSKEEDGSYSNLPKPNIDTGMGLERMAAMMQDVESIFDVDSVVAIRDKVCEIAGVKYNDDPLKDISIRVITDHVRSMTFMTADGILPANEGRGYVLKRLLRRAARHGRLLGIDRTFLAEAGRVAVEVSKGAYPELLEKQDYIFKVISMEENRFYESLVAGIEILKGFIDRHKAARESMLTGVEAFKLYDTYGFPPELVREILNESGFDYEEEEFRREMEKQKNRARAARETSNYMGAEDTVYDSLPAGAATEFVGYGAFEADGRVVALVAGGAVAEGAAEGDEVSVILDRTPFYAESGGQSGDTGIITVSGGSVTVADCVKVAGGRTAHLGKVTQGTISVGDGVRAEINKARRTDTARNHSATHLLHKALREVLGSHVEQAGSLVTGEKLRFDFTHYEAVTREQLDKAERIVNEKILEGLTVTTEEGTIEEARARGAMALFGEKYGSVVRIVDMGGYSVELCGGTHIENTARIGTFRILSESGVASGVRRIEGLTGFGALEYYRHIDSITRAVAEAMKATPETVMKQLKTFMDGAREMGREVERLRAKMAGSMIDDILEQKEMIEGVRVVSWRADGMEPDALREMGDRIRDRLGSGIVLLASVQKDKANMLVMATDDTIKAGANAGAIVKEAVAAMGGKGGGRPNMAMAGGKDVGHIDDAFTAAKAAIQKMLAK